MYQENIFGAAKSAENKKRYPACRRRSVVMVLVKIQLPAVRQKPLRVLAYCHALGRGSPNC